MGPNELELFQQDQLDYQTVFDQATQIVNNAYIQNNANLKQAISRALTNLEDAVDQFISSLAP